MPQSQVLLRFHIDHVIAKQHRGRNALANLALCCPSCNSRKGTNIASIDPASRRLVPLFNPRREMWKEHFRFIGGRIVSSTPIGRATIHVLDFNEPKRITARETLMAEGLF
jgi:hypothetical protein